jgi:hypothetical protein
MNPLARAHASVGDALRRVTNRGERLLLFGHTVLSNKGADELLGEVYSGWEKVERSFHDAAQTPPTVIVYGSDDWPLETLARVRSWVILKDGATSGERHGCRLEGVAQYGDEYAQRLVSTGRAGTYTLPVEATNALITSAGDTLVTSGGDTLIWG